MRCCQIARVRNFVMSRFGLLLSMATTDEGFLLSFLKAELIKVTHMHCYPDMGDVKIGKLAVGPKSLPICKFVFWDSVGIFTTILYSFLFLSLVG